MSLETLVTPWAYDELQLIEAELGDTVDFANEDNVTKKGLIVVLTKTTVFLLTEDKQILKFGRTSLTSTDGKWDLVGLSEKQIRISKEEWSEAKKQIHLLQKTRRKGKKP
jgi:hypothetical protein